VEGSSTGDLECWMKGARDGASLSEESPWRGSRGGAPSMGTLEDMLGKSPDTGISLHGGPFPSEGNLVCVWGGGARIPGTLIYD
jgi:hypothetical protein